MPLRIPHAPMYDGSGDLETNVRRARTYLEQFPSDSERSKVRLLIYGLSGRADQVVKSYRGFKILDTPNKIFSALKTHSTKKPTPSQALHTIMQGANETADMLALRIRGLASKCMDPGSKKFDEFCLGFFTKGLKPNLAKQLTIAGKTTFEKARKLAKLIEESPYYSSLATIVESMQRQQYACMNKVLEWMTTTSAPPQRPTQWQRATAAPCPRPRYEPPANRGDGQPRRTPMDCFHCGKSGHSYRTCLAVSDGDKLRIRFEKAADANQRKGQTRAGPPRA